MRNAANISQRIVFLGFIIDLVSGRALVPDERLEMICDSIDTVMAVDSNAC